MNYFVSDLHLGHNNILFFDNRPFSSIEDHDNAIIYNWNNAVDCGDDVYLLGDVSFYNVTETINLLSMLNGHLHLIVGNHDKRFIKNENFHNLFVEIVDYKELYVGSDDYQVVLSHYPILAYKNLYRGWIHLYGHVHNSFEWGIVEHHKRMMKELYSKKDNKPAEDVYNAYNVGCMLPYMNYIPRTLQEIIDGYEMIDCNQFVNPILKHKK